MASPAPDSVVTTGKALILARKSAEHMSDLINDALAALETAIDDMVKGHGAKAMQAGECIQLLREAQRSHGLVMQAHNSLRKVLIDCDVEQPTDAQVLSIR